MSEYDEDARSRLRPRNDLDIYRELGRTSEAIASIRREIDLLRATLTQQLADSAVAVNAKLDHLERSIADAAKRANGNGKKTKNGEDGPWWSRQPTLALLVVLASLVVLLAAIGGADLISAIASRASP